VAKKRKVGRDVRTYHFLKSEVDPQLPTPHLASPRYKMEPQPRPLLTPAPISSLL
jgi:hypothetical protein